MQSCCVDVSTEQGVKGNRSYASFPSGEVELSSVEVPVLALRLPMMIQGTMNTRDIIVAQIDSYVDSAAALIRIYYFRDPTAITATWTPIRLGFQEQAINGAVTAFDPTKMVNLFETRIPLGNSLQFINPDKGNADFYMTHGDNLLVTLEAKNNSDGVVTIEWAEEI